MSDGVAIHGFTKEDTKGWNLDMRTLVRALFPMVFSENFDLIIGNTALANRIIDDFAKMEMSAPMKHLCPHISLLTEDRMVFQAYDYLQKTCRGDDWKVGDEVIDDEEKDGSGEQLLLAVMCKCAVISYIWDNVKAGQPDGDVASVSTLTALLMQCFKEDTRARAVKQLQKLLSEPDKVVKLKDPLTALMVGKGIQFADKAGEAIKEAEAQAGVEHRDMQRQLDRLQRERDDAQRDLEIERRRLPANLGGGDRGRGGADRGRGGDRGGRGRGGLRGGTRPTLPAFVFTNPSQTCDKSTGGCGGTGHLKERCVPLINREGDHIVCDRCRGSGHRVFACPSDFTLQRN